MIFGDFLKALGQLPDKPFQRVLWLGVGLTVSLLIGAYALLLWLVSFLDPESVTIPGVGEITWIGDLLSWGSLFFMIILSIFLMIPVASAITSLFLDDVAKAVEDKHYPHLRPAPRVPFFDGLKDSVNFLGLLIVANVLALFLYVLLPFAAPLIFYGLNGFLLGREYFQLAAMRRIGRDAAKEMRRKHLASIWFAGCLMAIPLTIPLINLLVPILGAATFTHLFHRLSGNTS